MLVGVPVKENCKTGMERQVGKTSIFTKESLVVIQDKMRSKCIEEFNLTYSKDNKLKKKEKGKNRDYSAYERLKFNEKAEKLKQELNGLREDVSELKDNKQKINKEINDLNNDKEDIKKEIDKKKKVNNKIVIKSKNQLWEENEQLKIENENYKRLSNQYEGMYNRLKEKTDYLIKQLNKVLEKLPKFIQEAVNHLFNYSGMDLKRFKEEYDPEYKKKSIIDIVKKPINIFKKKEYYYEDEEKLEKNNDDGMEL